MSEGQVRMWNGQGWLWVDDSGPVTLPEPWEQMVKTILEMLGHREISPDRAGSWLWTMVEFAEVTYG